MRSPKQLAVVCLWVRMFGLLYAASIRNPIDIDDIIDLDHDHLTYHPHHFSDDVIPSKYNFRLNKGDNFVPLRRNHHIDLNAPMCFIRGGKVECELGKEKDTHFYHDDSRSVAVAISNENGTMKMKGIMTTDNHSIDIDPLEATDLPANRYHVIKKRWTANIIQKKVSSPYKELPPFRQPRGSAYCIDILCVVDYSVYTKFLRIEKYEEAALRKIRFYYSHVINGVNMRYASIGSKDLEINVRLAGFFIAKRPDDLPFINSKKMQKDPNYRVDSNFTLTYLDMFLKSLQSKRNPSVVLPDYNHATLFIEYSATNLGGSVLGTSYVSGICSRTKSTSLVVDNGAYTSAGITTHELGHSLGVFYHDGEGPARSSTCNASFNYIMAPASFLIDDKNLKYSFSFSTCSLKQIRDNLKKLVKINRSCIECRSRTRNSLADLQIDQKVRTNLDTLPGEVDSVHAQCKHIYGPGSFMCPPQSPEELCYRMYCYDPRRSACAIISEQMAADGTPCGKYKICAMGKCIKDSTRGKDVLDDCPYPDLPSAESHCEDATPFMCKMIKFRQRCCSSCNKEFTEEESCKDSTRFVASNMNCKALIRSPYGVSVCNSDYTVQNACCLSCKGLLRTGSGGSVMVHIGIGVSRNGPSAKQSSKSKYGSTKISSNKPSSSKSSSSKSSSSRSSANKYPTKPNPPMSGKCEDMAGFTVNNKQCAQLIYEESRFCRDSRISTGCCKSCKPHMND